MSPVLRFIPQDMKSSLIYIVSYHDKNPCGYLTNALYSEEKHFKSAIQLIFIIDKLLDELEFPQRDATPRAFNSAIKHNNFLSAGGEKRENPIATFRINVMFRQNASWQGSFLWIDKAVEGNFRSVLEFLYTLDSVFDQQSQN